MKVTNHLRKPKKSFSIFPSAGSLLRPSLVTWCLNKQKTKLNVNKTKKMGPSQVKLCWTMPLTSSESIISYHAELWALKLSSKRKTGDFLNKSYYVSALTVIRRI